MAYPSPLPREPLAISGLALPMAAVYRTVNEKSTMQFRRQIAPDPIDVKLARITARIAARRDECPACEARAERSAIIEHDGRLPRAEAERMAREAHPCEHP